MEILKESNEPFVDAQKVKKQHPKTFQAPTLEELNKIHPEDFIKVCTGGERFWLEVVTVDGEKITGRIDNDLVNGFRHGLFFDDMVEVEKRNVYNIEKAKPKKCLAIRPPINYKFKFKRLF